MRTAFFSAFLQMICVSYSILVTIFTATEILSDAVGPVTPETLLILFVMCVLVSLWNMLFRRPPSSLRRLAIRYAGGAAIVLSIGVLYDGFIPPNLRDMLTACLIVAAVYAGTWLYLVVTARVEAAEINRGLKKREAKRRKTP